MIDYDVLKCQVATVVTLCIIAYINLNFAPW